jgi:hypothetical protein
MSSYPMPVSDDAACALSSPPLEAVQSVQYGGVPGPSGDVFTLFKATAENADINDFSTRWYLGVRSADKTRWWLGSTSASTPPAITWIDSETGEELVPIGAASSATTPWYKKDVQVAALVVIVVLVLVFGVVIGHLAKKG